MARGQKHASQSKEAVRAASDRLGMFGKDKELTPELKEKAIIAILESGTLRHASVVTGVSVRVLNEEINKSALFRKRIVEARRIGKAVVADRAVDALRECVEGTLELGKSRLTASIALANAYADGFKTQKVEHDISGTVRVVTAVPRPKYLAEADRKQLAPVVTEGEFTAVKEPRKRGRPRKIIVVV